MSKDLKSSSFFSEKTKRGSQATDEQKDELKAEILTVLKNAQPPDSQDLEKLINDFNAASADGEFAPQEILVLQADVAAVLERANTSVEALKDIIADVRTMPEAANLNNDKQIIIDDLKAMAAEFQERHESLPSAKRR